MTTTVDRILRDRARSTPNRVAIEFEFFVFEDPDGPRREGQALIPVDRTGYFEMQNSRATGLCQQTIDALAGFGVEVEASHAEVGPGQHEIDLAEHGALQAHLAHLLLSWIDVDPPRRRGYVYTELRTNVAGASKLPDVAFYRHRPRESARKHALEVADVAVEILSPRDDLEDQLAKCQWYVDHGAQVGVLVDPVQRSVTLIESGGRVEVYSTRGSLVLLPGLELLLEDVFAVLDV